VAKLKLPLLEQIVDEFTRQSIQFIRDFIDQENVLKGEFRHMEVTFNGSETRVFPHGLGFIPKDIVQTSLVGASTITYNYSAFTKDNISITSTAACVLRFFVGRV
jgi:hypothetical protein